MKKNKFSSKKIKNHLAALAMLAISFTCVPIPSTGAGETQSLQSEDAENVSQEEVASYLAARGYTVYWIQSIPGSSNLRAGVGNGQTVIIYTSGGNILGHLDSGNN